MGKEEQDDQVQSSASARRVNVVSFLLSFLFVAGVIGLIELTSRVVENPPTVTTIRKVDVALPAPPPPPPPEPRQVVDALDQSISIDMGTNASGARIQFSERPKLADVSLESLPEPDLNYKMDLTDDMTSDIRSFRFEQLDETPTIINSRQSRIAPELRCQGIRQVEAQVDIIIDTRGQAYIRRIVDAGYPEMIPIIREHIDAIEFTIPKKDGQPVNGEYLLTIRFKELL